MRRILTAAASDPRRRRLLPTVGVLISTFSSMRVSDFGIRAMEACNMGITAFRATQQLCPTLSPTVAAGWNTRQAQEQPVHPPGQDPKRPWMQASPELPGRGALPRKISDGCWHTACSQPSSSLPSTSCGPWRQQSALRSISLPRCRFWTPRLASSCSTTSLQTTVGLQAQGAVTVTPAELASIAASLAAVQLDAASLTGKPLSQAEGSQSWSCISPAASCNASHHLHAALSA